VIQSDYINVSKQTKKEIEQIEKQYLYHKKLEKYKDDPNKFMKYYNSIKDLPIIKRNKFKVDENNLNQLLKKILTKHNVCTNEFDHSFIAFSNSKLPAPNAFPN
jgi:serine phosphatase RsbU (regulator of sigma subunit)